MLKALDLGEEPGRAPGGGTRKTTSEQEPQGGEDDSEDSEEGSDGQESRSESEQPDGETAEASEMTESADTEDFEADSRARRRSRDGGAVAAQYLGAR